MSTSRMVLFVKRRSIFLLAGLSYFFNHIVFNSIPCLHPPHLITPLHADKFDFSGIYFVLIIKQDYFRQLSNFQKMNGDAEIVMLQLEASNLVLSVGLSSKQDLS